MTRPLRVGVAGVGGISALMADAAKSLHDVEFVACAASGPASAQRFAAAHGLDVAHANFDALVADDDVEAIYIATPNGLHPAQTLEALAAGKHVLVEKPMALTTADAVAMVEAAAAQDRVLGVGFHLRHNAVLQEVKRRVESGAIGVPKHIHAAWGISIAAKMAAWKQDPAVAGAGAIMGLGVHVLDLLCWLLGSPPSRLTALTDADGEEMDATVLLALAFDTCLADVEVTRRFPLRPNGLVVYGSEGSLTARDSLTMHGDGELLGHDGEVLMASSGNPYARELAEFAAAVRGEKEFRADGSDGVRSVELTTLALEAAAAARPVALSGSAED